MSEHLQLQFRHLSRQINKQKVYGNN